MYHQHQMRKKKIPHWMSFSIIKKSSLHHPAHTSSVESRSLGFNLAGIMRGINLDSDRCHGNGLPNRGVSIDGTMLDQHMHTNTSDSRYLISKQNHDGVAACSRGHVFDCERVIVISNNVKIDISFIGSHHSGSTFDAYADVSWKQTKKILLSLCV